MNAIDAALLTVFVFGFAAGALTGLTAALFVGRRTDV